MTTASVTALPVATAPPPKPVDAEDVKPAPKKPHPPARQSPQLLHQRGLPNESNNGREVQPWNRDAKHVATVPTEPKKEPSTLDKKPNEPKQSSRETTKGRKKESSGGPRKPDKAGVGNKAGEFTGPSGYVALVKKTIRSNMFYPKAALSRGITGKVTFAFTIGRKGRVTSFRVVNSSGSKVLDAAAEKILRSVRLPPPPSGQLSATSTLAFGEP